jgi:hypothetical protein
LPEKLSAIDIFAQQPADEKFLNFFLCNLRLHSGVDFRTGERGKHNERASAQSGLSNCFNVQIIVVIAFSAPRFIRRRKKCEQNTMTKPMGAPMLFKREKGLDNSTVSLQISLSEGGASLVALALTTLLKRLYKRTKSHRMV